MNIQTKIFPDLDSLTIAVGQAFINIANEAIKMRGNFCVSLSGGNTPEKLFRFLAEDNNRSAVRWDKCNFYWGDERCVHPTDPDSCYGQAKALFLDALKVPDKNIHRIQGELGGDQASKIYSALLTQHSSLGALWPRFDLVLLGLGSDGHTASLFPGPITREEVTSSVINVHADYQDRPSERVSLTPQVINAAENIFFLVAGSSKADAVYNTILGNNDIIRWPAKRIRPNLGNVVWFLDHLAAVNLDQ